jgi:subtilisin family serine protease
MKKLICKGISLCLAATLVFGIGFTNTVKASADVDNSEIKFTDNSIIIKYENNVSEDLKLELREKYSVKGYKEIESLNIEVLKLDNCKDILEMAKELANNKSIEYAEPDYLSELCEIKDDSNKVFTGEQPIYGEERLWALEDMNVPKAWEITKGSEDVVVGLLGGGVDYTHRDLIDAIWVNEGEVPDDGIDNDNNGYIDDVHGWNFRCDNNIIDTMDEAGDVGTFNAGIIAGQGKNNEKVVGVAPNVKIAPLQFVVYRSGSVSDLIEAIEYANKMNIKILSISWIFDNYSQALKDAITNYNGLLVAPATDYKSNNDIHPRYPVCYDNDNMITSTALIPYYHHIYQAAGYGMISIDVGAPGHYICSTIPNGKYGWGRGTFAANAHVAGVAALLLSKDKSLTPEEIKEAIMSSVYRLQTIAHLYIRSAGTVDAYEALKSID